MSLLCLLDRNKNIELCCFSDGKKKLSVISGVSFIEYRISQTVLRYAMMPQSKSIYFNINFLTFRRNI